MSRNSLVLLTYHNSSTKVLVNINRINSAYTSIITRNDGSQYHYTTINFTGNNVESNYLSVAETVEEIQALSKLQISG